MVNIFYTPNLVFNSLNSIGIPYVKSISKLDDGDHESRGSERWVKEKLEEIAFKIQDQEYDE